MEDSPSSYSELGAFKKWVTRAFTAFAVIGAYLYGASTGGSKAVVAGQDTSWIARDLGRSSSCTRAFMIDMVLIYDPNFPKVVGSVKKSDVDEAWRVVAETNDDTLRVKFVYPNGDELSLKVSTNIGFKSIDGDKTIYKSLALESYPEVTYSVTCQSDKRRCTVALESDISAGRQLESGACFSPNAGIIVEGKGTVAMKDLKINDKVLSSNGSFQNVYGFGHISRTDPANMLQLFVEAQAKPLEISFGHLIYVHGIEYPVHAETVKVGDHLITADGTPTKVTKIRKITTEGFFMPLTVDGTIVVDNIVASAYAVVGEAFGVQSHVELYGIPVISWHNMNHLYQAPNRVVCLWVAPQLCEHSENKQQKSAASMDIGRVLLKLAAISDSIRGLLFVLVLCLCAPFLLLEKLLLMSTTHHQAAALVVGMFGATLFFLKRHVRSKKGKKTDACISVS